MKTNEQAEYSAETKRFEKFRNSVVLVTGLLMTAAGVRYGLVSRAVDGGWALNQWPFLFMVIVGIAVLAMTYITWPRSNHR